MNITQQLKHYRQQFELSKEALAEKLFISRQTISNWETGRSYPDLRSLLMLSDLFNVSLDELVKGDLMMMENKHAIQKMTHYLLGMLIFWGLMIIAVPLGRFIKFYSLAIGLVFWLLGMYCALQVEKTKKKFDVQTFAEISAFLESRDYDVSQKEREKERKKMRVKKIGMMGVSAVLTLVLLLLLTFIVEIW